MALQPDCGSWPVAVLSTGDPRGTKRAKLAPTSHHFQPEPRGAQVPGTLCGCSVSPSHIEKQGARGACGVGAGRGPDGLSGASVPTSRPTPGQARETGTNSLPVKLQQRVLHILPACPHGSPTLCASHVPAFHSGVTERGLLFTLVSAMRTGVVCFVHCCTPGTWIVPGIHTVGAQEILFA